MPICSTDSLRLLRTSLFCLFTLLSSAASGLSAEQPSLAPIDVSPDAGDAQFTFLAPLVKDVEVVSLAESIHMTHEFPLARIGMVRWLNQNAGFGMFAIEGSPEDVWVSQDAFLSNPADLDPSTSGIFAIWNTPEMKQLFAYEAKSWQTAHPLYITAYDIQPGTGRESPGAQIFPLLAQRLAAYAPAPAGLDLAAWARQLAPLTNACSAYHASDEAGIRQAIGKLEEWIERAAPQVQRAYPLLPHAAALRLIPENLRGSIALCKGVEGAGYGADIYKPTRDKNASQYALRVKGIAPGGKLILWAHVSHLFYDQDGDNNTSVGELLHNTLGSKLYTIGTFAGGGGAIMLFSDWDEIIGYGRVWGVSSELRDSFAALCPQVCFADLKSVSADSPFARPQTAWYEAERSRMTLAKDFDGIVWVKTVHPPTLPFAQLLSLCTMSYRLRYWGIPSGVLVLAVLGMAIVIRWRRRRRL
jgi:erythromycin esterase-like protein